MAFGQKYNFYYKEPFFERHLNRISIFEYGYTGAIIEKTLAVPPDTLNYKSSGEVLDTAMRGTELVFNVWVETEGEFEEMYFATRGRYIVIKYIAGLVHFRGFLQPELYSEPYTPAPYMVSFHATDGLGILKNHIFEPPPQPRLPNLSLLEIIVLCLKPILQIEGDDLVKPYIYDSCYIYENFMDITPYKSPFADLIVPPEMFKDKDGEYDNCYNILREIMERFHCYIRWSGNGFRIMQINVAKDEPSWILRKFTYEGEYVGYEVMEDPVTMTDADADSSELMTFLDNSQALSFEPGWRSFTIKQDYGRIENLITGWTKHLQLSGSDAYEANGIIFFKTWDQSAVYSNSRNQPNVENEYIELHAGSVAESMPAERKRSNPRGMDIYAGVVSIEIKLAGEMVGSKYARVAAVLYTGSAYLYYDKNEAKWTSTKKYIYKTGETGSDNISITGIPTNGHLSLRYYVYCESGKRPAPGEQNIAPHYRLDLNNTSVSFKMVSNEVPDSLTIRTDINSKNEYDEERSFRLGDLPDGVDNVGLLYQNRMIARREVSPGIYDSKFTSSWRKTGRNGKEGSATLNEMLADEISMNHYHNSIKLEGTIRGRVNILNRVETGGLRYSIINAKENRYDNEMEVVMIYIDKATPTITQQDVDYLEVDHIHDDFLLIDNDGNELIIDG